MPTSRSWFNLDPMKFGDPLTPLPLDGENHWEKCRQLMTRHDDSVADDYRQEIQNQLLVAGLLSAVTTAFVAEMQKPDDKVALPAVLLAHIVTQLNESIRLPPYDFASALGSPSSQYSEVTAALWYTSLSLSITTVTVGLLCLQWIQEYRKDAPYLGHETYFEFRHIRETGFEGWGATAIISAIPLLLICSLVTFSCGLLVFLGTTSWAVASPVYIVILAMMSLLLFTTFAPGIATLRACVVQHHVRDVGFNPPFKSLQSWIVLRLYLFFVSLRFASPIRSSNFYRQRNLENILKCRSWLRVDIYWAQWSKKRCDESFRPVVELFSDRRDTLMALYRCVSELSPTRIRSTFLDIPLVSGTSDFVARATEFFLFFRFMDHYNREQEPIPLAWRDHILERYIQVANAGLEKHVPCSKLLDILSDSMPIPLDLLLQLLHCMQLKLRSSTWVNISDTPILWATLGRVVFHDHLPAGDLQPILIDILDDFVKERQSPKNLQETIAFRANLFTSMVQDSSSVNKSKTRRVLYCLSRHPAWEVLQEVWHFKKLVNSAGAEDVVQPGCLPPVEWEIQVVGPPYIATAPVAAASGRLADGSLELRVIHDLSEDEGSTVERDIAEETTTDLYEHISLDRSTEQLPMQHYEGLAIDLPPITCNARTKRLRPTLSCPDLPQTLSSPSLDKLGLEAQASRALPDMSGPAHPSQELTMTQSFPEPPRHPRRVTRRVRPTLIASDRTDDVIEEERPSTSILCMTPSHTI